MKAIIDLGTNTFHLLIAQVKNNSIQEFYKMQVPVKIGSGGINKGFITSEAYKRGLVALNEFKKHITVFGVDEVLAFATSAIRNASNGNVFIKDVKQQCNIDIKAITGDEEATYIYNGVMHSFNFPDEAVLVMDIGGGSVEFIIGVKQQILYKQSFEIGAARLMDMFQKNNPITDEEQQQIINYLTEKLAPLLEAVKLHQPKVMVGAAGSFETLLDIVLNDLGVIPRSLTKFAYEIRREDFDVFVEIMLTSTIEQRKKLKGMTGFRVEMIVVAAILMRQVILTCNISRIITSDYALKEGVLFS